MIGTLGRKIIFEVSDNRVLTFESMSREVSGRWTEHEVLGVKPKAEFLGPGLQTISLTIHLSAALGVKPRRILDMVERMVERGSAEYLVIGGGIGVEPSAEFQIVVLVAANGDVGVAEIDGKYHGWCLPACL